MNNLREPRPCYQCGAFILPYCTECIWDREKQMYRVKNFCSKDCYDKYFKESNRCRKSRSPKNAS